MIPWILRGQLLIPALQIVGVTATLRLLRRWRLHPERRPSGRRKWGLYILLPLIPNLLVTLTLTPMLGKTRGYLMLYMPDYSWTALVCGSFAGIRSLLIQLDRDACLCAQKLRCQRQGSNRTEAGQCHLMAQVKFCDCVRPGLWP